MLNLPIHMPGVGVVAAVAAAVAAVVVVADRTATPISKIVSAK